MRVQQNIKDNAGDKIEVSASKPFGDLFEQIDGEVELNLPLDEHGDVIGYFVYTPKRARKFALALLRAADKAEAVRA